MIGNLTPVQHEKETAVSISVFVFSSCIFIISACITILHDDQFSTKKETACLQFRVCFSITILHFIFLARIAILHDDQFSMKKKTAISNFLFHRKTFHIAKPPARANTRAISHLRE